MSREKIVDALVTTRVLWPLVDYAPSCRLCAAPRQRQLGQVAVDCCSCRDLADLYDKSLTDLYPITYTTPQWPLCAAVRALKDIFHARSNNHLARNLGAILSAYLEAQLADGRLVDPVREGIVTTVPSSRPVIAAALRRAAQEGWWAPHLVTVATTRPGHRRQRQRPDAKRMYICDKWDVDRAAVTGLDVLVLDDIYTSGGSVHSLAHALRTAGAASVRAVVLARNVGAHGAWVLPLLRAACDAGRSWTPAANKDDVLNGDATRSWHADEDGPRLNPRAEGGRGPAQNGVREAPRRSCRPCRPRSPGPRQKSRTALSRQSRQTSARRHADAPHQHRAPRPESPQQPSAHPRHRDPSGHDAARARPQHRLTRLNAPPEHVRR